MARHGSHDQELLLRLGRFRHITFETQEFAKIPLPNNPFGDGDGFTVHARRIQAKNRFAVTPGQTFEQFGGSRHIAADMGVRQWIDRIIEPDTGDIGQSAGRRKRQIGHFMHLVGIKGHVAPLPISTLTLIAQKQIAIGFMTVSCCDFDLSFHLNLSAVSKPC